MRLITPVVLLFAVVFLWGCSNKTPTQPSGGGTLPAAAEQAMAVEAQTYSTMATSFVGGLSSGLTNFVPGQPSSLNSPPTPPLPLLDPPTGWSGPMTNPHQTGMGTTWYWAGWYYTFAESASSYTVNDTVYVKFTPDIWGSGQPPVTRVDWEALVNVSSVVNNVSTQSVFDEKANARYSANGTDTTKTDGDFSIVGSVSTSSVATANFSYQFTWANCTRAGWDTNPRTCSGTMSWSATSTYALQNYTMSGSYAFTNGSGTGEAKSGDVTFARYVFNSNGSGYYTLLSENWQTQHPFTW